jgi:hypothetical protein
VELVASVAVAAFPVRFPMNVGAVIVPDTIAFPTTSSLADGVVVPIPTSFDQSIYIGIAGVLMPAIADSSVMSPADHPVSHHD